MAPFAQRAASPPHLRCGGARHGRTGGRDGTVATCHAAMVHVIISGRHLRRTVCPPAICRRQLVHSHWQPGAPCCGFVGSPLSRARGCVHAVSLSVMSFRMFYVKIVANPLAVHSLVAALCRAHAHAPRARRTRAKRPAPVREHTRTFTRYNVSRRAHARTTCTTGEKTKR